VSPPGQAAGGDAPGAHAISRGGAQHGRAIGLQLLQVALRCRILLGAIDGQKNQAIANRGGAIFIL
jgi:hypothetical protein